MSELKDRVREIVDLIYQGINVNENYAILDLADFREVVTMPHNDVRVSVVFREVVTMTDDATL